MDKLPPLEGSDGSSGNMIEQSRSSSKIPRVLLIYDSFPPEKSSGIGRPSSLFEYLPEFGLSTFVLTKNSYGQIPEEKKVLRVDALDLWRSSARYFPHKILSWIFFRLGTVSNDLLFFFRARRELDRLAREGIDIIYASFPYTNPFLLGIYAKKRYGIPFIAEFRDGYLFEPLFDKNSLQTIIAKRFERKLARECSSIVTIGKHLTAYFERTYPRKPCYTVYNGYSQIPLDFSEFKNERKTAITIGYFGSFLLLRNKKRGIHALSTGVKAAVNSAGVSPENFRMVFIGNFLDSEKEAFTEVGLGPYIEFKPYMSKERGFAYLSVAVDYLLFIGVEGETTIVSAKLPEYLMLGKPILGICEGNEAANVIRDTHSGEVSGFGSDDVEMLIGKALRKEISYSPDAVSLSGFDRRNQAAKVAEIIQNAISLEKES